MVKGKINKKIYNHLINKKHIKTKEKEKKIPFNTSKSFRIHIRKKIKFIKNKSSSLNNKNNFNCEKEIKNIILSKINNSEQKELNEEEIFYAMRCYECSYIPLIKIKYSDINLLQNKESFLESHKEIVLAELLCSKGHLIITPLKQYLINCGINHNFISLCGQCHKNKPNELFNFSFCKSCKKTLCLECSENHNHQKSNCDQNLSIVDMKNNNLISICQLDFHCQYHNKEFNSFCKDCNINLCKECENNHDTTHKIVILEDIKLRENEISIILFNINLAKKRLLLFDFKILKFIQSLHKLEKLYLQLLNLYNDFKSIYKEQISFSEMVLSIYKNASKKNKYNYQIIQNVRNLKFNIRGIPIKNSSDFTTNIKSLTSYLTNSKNFLLIDIKNYHSSKKILKARVRAAAKRLRSKIYLNNKANKNNFGENKP